MRIEFIDEIAKRQNVKRKDLIEKDILLHQLLTDLSNDKFFSKNFIFKGGTCLVKSYLGYYRFSEDVDFTWKDQDIFIGKNGMEIRKMLSKITDKIGKILEDISKNRNLDFKYEKTNTNYVAFGGRNRMCTLFIYYDSVVLKMKTFFKVQINFEENLCLKHRKNELKSLMPDRNEEMEYLFSEFKEYNKTINFVTYGVKEILSEKIRAILTRKGIKARDFLDVYLICKEFDIKLTDIEKCIKKKIKHSLGLYEKYRENIEQKKKHIDDEKFFELGDERELLLKKINDDEYNKFMKQTKKFLKKIINKF